MATENKTPEWVVKVLAKEKANAKLTFGQKVHGLVKPAIKMALTISLAIMIVFSGVAVVVHAGTPSKKVPVNVTKIAEGEIPQQAPHPAQPEGKKQENKVDMWEKVIDFVAINTNVKKADLEANAHQFKETFTDIFGEEFKELGAKLAKWVGLVALLTFIAFGIIGFFIKFILVNVVAGGIRWYTEFIGRQHGTDHQRVLPEADIMGALGVAKYVTYALARSCRTDALNKQFYNATRILQLIDAYIKALEVDMETALKAGDKEKYNLLLKKKSNIERVKKKSPFLHFWSSFRNFRKTRGFWMEVLSYSVSSSLLEETQIGYELEAIHEKFDDATVLANWGWNGWYWKSFVKTRRLKKVRKNLKDPWFFRGVKKCSSVAKINIALRKAKFDENTRYELIELAAKLPLRTMVWAFVEAERPTIARYGLVADSLAQLQQRMQECGVSFEVSIDPAAARTESPGQKDTHGASLLIVE